jgi:Tfp pilus assembly protein PilV
VERVAARGFSLVEAIASIVLIAVSLPATLWALGEAHQRRSAPALASRARWLATEKLEDIIADRHSATRGHGYLVPGNYPDEAQVAGFETYSRRVALVETGADLVAPGEGYTTVTVTVEWRGADGQARSLSVSTVLTEYAG